MMLVLSDRIPNCEFYPVLWRQTYWHLLACLLGISSSSVGASRSKQGNEGLNAAQ